jgi:hypothetical protein
MSSSSTTQIKSVSTAKNPTDHGEWRRRRIYCTSHGTGPLTRIRRNCTSLPEFLTLAAGCKSIVLLSGGTCWSLLNETQAASLWCMPFWHQFVPGQSKLPSDLFGSGVLQPFKLQGCRTPAPNRPLGCWAWPVGCFCYVARLRGCADDEFMVQELLRTASRQAPFF